MKRQAVILAGGRGTRLRAVTGNLPKVLAEVGGTPVLGHQLALCRAHGFDDVLLLLGYEAEVIRRYVGDGSAFGLRVQTIAELEPRGSAGAVLEAREHLAGRFLVLYGDTMLDVDLSRLWNFHGQNGAAATLLVHPNDHPFDSDLVRVGGNNRITGFTRWDDSRPRPDRNLVSAALYVLERGALVGLESVPRILDFGRDVFPRLLEEGAVLTAYRSVEYIKDMGTPERLARVNADLACGKVNPASSGRARPAVFLDRDGTLNVEKNGVLRAADLDLLPGAPAAVRRLNHAGLATVIITNQPYISHGKMTEDDLDAIHAGLERQLAKAGAFVDAFYHCPHHPHAGHAGEIAHLKIACDCRKPALGLIERAVAELHLDLAPSWFVGDQTSDLETAARAGLRSILVTTGHAGRDGRYAAQPSYVFDDVDAASRFITEGYPVMRRQADELAGALYPGAEVLIGGLARSGKSTWTSLLAEALRARALQPFVLSFDDWLRDEADQGDGVMTRYDVSAVDGLLAKLRSAREPLAVSLPIYDRLAKRRTGERKVRFEPGSVIILEGVLALSAHSPMGKRISVTLPDPVRRVRFGSFYRGRGYAHDRIEALWNRRELDEIPVIRATCAGSEIWDGHLDCLEAHGH